MNKIYIDFETRSKCDIKLGGWVYSADPSTDVMCASFLKEGKGETVTTLPFVMGCFNSYPAEYLEEFRELCSDESNVFVAHNAFFEQIIYFNIFVKRFGFPRLEPHRWRCTMAQCYAMNVPGGLNKAAIFLNLDTKKDMFGSNSMLKLSKPKPLSKKAKERGEVQGWDGDVERYEQMYQYCEQDVAVTRQIHKRLPQLSADEQRVWEQDQRINLRGFKCDAELIARSNSVADRYAEDVNRLLEEKSEGAIKSYSMLNSFKVYFEKLGYPVESLNREMVNKILDDPEAPEKVKEILRLRLAVGKTSVRKYASFQNCSDEEFIMRGTLQYHAASTGRWGGRLVQVQNLPRGEFKATEESIKEFKESSYEVLYDKHGHSLMELLSSNIRSCIIARPGKKLIWSDFNAIETRVLAWLAGEDKILNSYEEGRDVYCEMASAIYNKEVTKADTEMRQMGKKAILGCGYGMGNKKFKMVCEYEGNNIDDTFAKKVISTYRNTYSKIPEFWKKINLQVMQAIRDKGSVIDGGKYKIVSTGEVLYIQLPSGRNLAYFDPRIAGGDVVYRGTNSQTRQTEQIKTYGGRLTENIVQAIARDLLVFAMGGMENFDLDILFTVHDEIVVEAPLDYPEAEMTMTYAMELKPSWASDLPLAAETTSGERYAK